jgi:hypothetical protein
MKGSARDHFDCSNIVHLNIIDVSIAVRTMYYNPSGRVRSLIPIIICLFGGEASSSACINTLALPSCSRGKSSLDCTTACVNNYLLEMNCRKCLEPMKHGKGVSCSANQAILWHALPDGMNQCAQQRNVERSRRDGRKVNLKEWDERLTKTLDGSPNLQSTYWWVNVNTWSSIGRSIRILQGWLIVTANFTDELLMRYHRKTCFSFKIWPQNDKRWCFAPSEPFAFR